MYNSVDFIVKNINIFFNDFYTESDYNDYRMTVTIRPVINKQIFSWAITRVGISEREAVEHYPHFMEWQNGEKFATVNQLKDFSHRYHFPFGYFFLNTIPSTPKTEIPFFRSSDDYNALENENVNETVKILRERQEWLSEYLVDNGIEKNEALGLCKNENDIQKIINQIMDFFELESDWNLKRKNSDEALKYITNKLEEKNIVVTFNSVVNNNTSRTIPVKLCRGFCLIDEYVPFIFINSSDSKNAQLFSLIHEVAHVFISYTSGFGEHGTKSIVDAKESLCDKVAANLLVPSELLLQNKNKTNTELATLFKVSEVVILRRKLDSGLITQKDFFEKYNTLPQYKKTGSGGGDFYRTAELRISQKLLRCLTNAMYSRNITPLEAYHLAGVRGDVFTKLTAGEFR